MRIQKGSDFFLLAVRIGAMAGHTNRLIGFRLGNILVNHMKMALGYLLFMLQNMPKKIFFFAGRGCDGCFFNLKLGKINHLKEP